MSHPVRDRAAREHLTRIQELWEQLRQAADQKERDVLEQQLREEVDAYKRATGRDFDS